MKLNRGRAALAAGVVISLGAMFSSGAGPLDPPAGAVTATGPTMLFDAAGSATIAITASGSYRLAGDIIDGGLVITANDVVVDLNGFAIRRLPGPSGTAVSIPNAQSNITIRNGTIRGFQMGIIGATTSGLRVETMTIQQIGIDVNTHRGIQSGDGASLIDCTVSTTGGGVLVGARSTATNCRVFNNGSGLLTMGDHSVATGCTCYNNAQSQLSVGIESVVTNCVAMATGVPSNQGLTVGAGSTVTGCTLGGALGSALSAGERSVVRGCSLKVTSSSATACASLAANCTMVDCSLAGPLVGQASTVVENCSLVLSASATGITVGSGSTVRECSVTGGTTGVTTVGSASRIEGNRISGSATGILLSGASTNNLVARNTLSGSATPISNLNVAANSVAAVLNVAGMSAFSNSAPWANLTY